MEGRRKDGRREGGREVEKEVREEERKEGREGGGERWFFVQLTRLSYWDRREGSRHLANTHHLPVIQSNTNLGITMMGFWRSN